MIVITRKGNNRQIRIKKENNNEVQVIQETQLSPSQLNEYIHISAILKNFSVPRPSCNAPKEHSQLILSLNLSSYFLSKIQKRILMKDLKYTPGTPRKNIIEFKQDIVEFKRKLRLLEMSSSEEQEAENLVNVSLISQKVFVTLLEIGMSFLKIQLIFCNNKH